MNDAPPYPVPGSPAPKTSGLAITSLVLGILSVVLFCISPLFAIPAVICGHIANSKIGRSGGALGGKGVAIGGLVAGYLGLLIFLSLIPTAVKKGRQYYAHGVCIFNVAEIQKAKQDWAAANHKGLDAVPTAEDLDKYLVGGKHFDQLKCPSGGTYTINAVGKTATCSLPEHQLPSGSVMSGSVTNDPN